MSGEKIISRNVEEEIEEIFGKSDPLPWEEEIEEPKKDWFKFLREKYPWLKTDKKEGSQRSEKL